MEAIEKTAEKIAAAATAAGFTLKTRTPFVSGSLPINTAFSFDSYKIDGEGGFRHIRLIVDEKYSISVGSLRSMFYMGTLAEAKESISNVDEKKGFTLKGVKSLNPSLGQFSDDAKIAAYLLNLTTPIFAEKISGIVLNAPFENGKPKVIKDLTIAKSLCVVKEGFVLTIND